MKIEILARVARRLAYHDARAEDFEKIAFRCADHFVAAVNDPEEAQGWATRGDIALLTSVLGAELRAINHRLQQLVEIEYGGLREFVELNQEEDVDEFGK